MVTASRHYEDTNTAEIISLVRSGDYDRFLAIQLAPKETRAALYTLTAFYVEVARIAETVSEPLIGHMRLAWWREAIDELKAGNLPRNHPVILALAPLLVDQPALAPCLLQMLEARAADFDDALLADEAAWLAYCDGTAGALHHAWALMLDSAAESHSAVIAQQARAYAMIGLVRSIPFMAIRGAMRFPDARLKAYGVTSLQPSPELNAMVASIVAQAVSSQMQERLKTSLKPLVWVALLNKEYTQRLQKNGYNPYELVPKKLGKVWIIAKLNYL